MAFAVSFQIQKICGQCLMLKHNVVPPLQPHFQTKNFSVTTDKAVVKENALRKLLFLFLFFKKKKKKVWKKERKEKKMSRRAEASSITVSS